VDAGEAILIRSVNFLAYGTKKYGTKVSAGDVDGDGVDEIITGPGPGAVFGPHVRGWNYDGDAITSIGGVSYFAYGTRKWGVNVNTGDLDNDGYAEILTGAGPAAIFGPHVRGWNHDGGGSTTSINTINFFAYGTKKYGVKVAAGNLDDDGFAEIVVAPGPGVVFGPTVKAYNFDGTAVNEVFSFKAFTGDGKYGANAAVCSDFMY
jgi:hypothetical protein